jgi:hypothetical protein
VLLRSGKVPFAVIVASVQQLATISMSDRAGCDAGTRELAATQSWNFANSGPPAIAPEPEMAYCNTEYYLILSRYYE